MGLWGATSSACESDVEKATSEKNTSEDWALIIEVCDKAGKSPQDAKDYLKAILKRVHNTDPHIAIQAVTLLDACVKNCGRTFHVEVASRDFENEYTKLVKKSHPQVSQKLRESLKKWADGEFKSDPQLTLIPTLYSKLRSSGTDFNFEEPKKSMTLSKDPNVVQTQEEEDQIAKAIELSLKETSAVGGSPRNAVTTAAAPTSGATSLYPSTNVAAATVASATSKEPRRVRALYDFEAAEDNELTFNSGEIIFILDDSDPNWWKGSNQRGEGLFPANFVSNDLTVDPEQLVKEKKKQLQQLDESLEKKYAEEAVGEPDGVEIDENKIDRLLHLLHEADPTNPEYDTKEMLGLEKEVNSMGSLIDKELERVDRKHAQLTQLSSDLVEALNLYHTLMREPQYSSIPVNKVPYGYQPPNSQPHAMMFNGNLPHQQPSPGSMGPPSMMAYGMPPPDRPFLPPQGPNMQYASLPHPGMPPHPPPGHMPPTTGAQMPSLPPHQMTAPPQSLQMHGPPPPHVQHDETRLPGPYPPQGFNFPGPHVHVLPGGPPGAQNGGSYSMPMSNSHIM